MLNFGAKKAPDLRMDLSCGKIKFILCPGNKEGSLESERIFITQMNESGAYNYDPKGFGFEDWK